MRIRGMSKVVRSLGPTSLLESHLVLYLAYIGKFFTSAVFLAVPVTIAELFPTEVRGTAFAFCTFVGRGAALTTSLVVGLDDYLAGAPLVVFAIPFFIACIQARQILPETLGRPLVHSVTDVVRQGRVPSTLEFCCPTSRFCRRLKVGAVQKSENASFPAGDGGA